MSLKPYARQVAALTARWTLLGGPWRESSGHFCVLFAHPAHFGARFVRLPVHFQAFFYRTWSSSRFFNFSGGSGTLADIKKPLKSTLESIWEVLRNTYRALLQEVLSSTCTY